mgnify:CR=1 FL=1
MAATVIGGLTLTGSERNATISALMCEKALRKNLCKFNNCDKNDIVERLEKSRSKFYCIIQ